tara:strand:- start:310 stop:600 length:291 start_codon:yes stop_codon:yes gene_type:complete
MIDDFTKEEKLSGGAVFERGVKQSKEHKAIRRIAQPLTDKHWLNKGQSVTQLHRIYRIAEYLLVRSKRPKKERQSLKEMEVLVPEGVKVKIKRIKK